MPRHLDKPHLGYSVIVDNVSRHDQRERKKQNLKKNRQIHRLCSKRLRDMVDRDVESVVYFYISWLSIFTLHCTHLRWLFRNIVSDFASRNLSFSPLVIERLRFPAKFSTDEKQNTRPMAPLVFWLTGAFFHDLSHQPHLTRIKRPCVMLKNEAMGAQVNKTVRKTHPESGIFPIYTHL